jgi:hypothetical protein
VGGWALIALSAGMAILRPGWDQFWLAAEVFLTGSVVLASIREDWSRLERIVFLAFAVTLAATLAILGLHGPDRLARAAVGIASALGVLNAFLELRRKMRQMESRSWG